MRRDQFILLCLNSRTDDCLMWPFAVRKSSGYGAHSFYNVGRKVNVDAHRFVCEEAYGPLPLEAAHSCGNKLCVNPRHLRWATHVENMRDAKLAGTIRGGGRHRQRLFEAEIEYIRTSGKSGLALAAEFGMEPSHICKVMRG